MILISIGARDGLLFIYTKNGPNLRLFLKTAEGWGGYGIVGGGGRRQVALCIIMSRDRFHIAENIV